MDTDLPLLCFGGPIQPPALEALLAEAARLGIPPARMLCTGDVVAYCAEPAATLDLMIAAGIPTVMGNCEESLAEGARIAAAASPRAPPATCSPAAGSPMQTGR
jgi:hypothetical protein